MKKIIGIVMAVAAAVMLAACQKGTEEPEGKKEYTAYSYLAAESDERMAAGLSGDRLYFVRSVPGGYELYASDLDTGRQEKVYGEADQEAPIHVSMLAAASNGQAALLKYRDRQPDTGVPGREYSVAVLKSDGSVQAEYDVTESFAGGSRPAAMMTDAPGNVYFVQGGEKTGENARILAFDPAGKPLHTFTPEEHEALRDTVRALFTDGAGHVYCACSSREAAGSRLYLAELLPSEKKLKEACRLAAEQTGNVHFAGNGGKLLYSEGEILYRLDAKSGEKKELLRWMDVDVNFGDIQGLVLRENGEIGIYRSYAGANTGGKWRIEVTLLREGGSQNEAQGSSPADSGSVGQTGGDQSTSGSGASDRAEEKVVLTYATMRLDDQMRSWIVNYNAEHTDCRIEVKEYGGEGTQEGLMRLNTDILSGHAPDIIDLENIDVGPYIAKGILTDLYPLMDADEDMGREEFVPGILNQYEENGKLYGVMAGYTLETLMGKESVLGTPDGWTVERMKEALAGVPEDGCFVDNLAPMGLLRILMTKGMGEYLDWEKGTCSFTGEGFIRVLELAASMGGKNMDGDLEENLSSGKVAVNRIYVGALSDYISSMEMFHGEKVSCVGFPSSRGGSALVYPFRPMGISGQNGHEELAWDFVRTLLDEEFQRTEVHFNLPVRLEVLRGKLELEAEMAAKRGQPIAQEDLEAFNRMIDVPGGKITFDGNVWKIISEEAEVYFNGQKSAEAVAETIQNRARLYVSENYVKGR